MPQSVTAVSPQGAAITAVETDVGIYRLDTGASLAVPFHISLNLLRRPLLLDHQREDSLAHVESECPNPSHTVLALIALALGEPVVVAVHSTIALYLTVDCADMHVQVLSNHFFAHFVLE